VITQGRRRARQARRRSGGSNRSAAFRRGARNGLEKSAFPQSAAAIGEPQRGKREQQGDAQNAHRGPRRRAGEQEADAEEGRKVLGHGRIFSIGTGRRQNPASQRLSVT
jgi:hypothetical protein